MIFSYIRNAIHNLAFDCVKSITNQNKKKLFKQDCKQYLAFNEMSLCKNF